MSHTPHRSTRRSAGAGRSRTVRTAVAGGLAVGTALAGFTGISLATSSSSHGRTTSASRASTAASARRGPRGRGPGAPGGPRGPKGLRGPRGPKGPGGPGGPAGPGGPNSGTITAISGSTLTLRTENGTETVETSSATTYTKELETISFSDLHTGDIVGVAPAPPSSTGSSSAPSTPPRPGTGTVRAAAVSVVEPSLTGRVTSHSNGTYRLVGPGGQLLSVRTTGSTRYESSSSSRTSASSISSGDHVVAEGTQTDLTHLTADVIAVMPGPPAPPAGGARTPRSRRAVSGGRRASRSSSSSPRSSTTSSR